MVNKSVVLYTDYKFILNFLSNEEKGILLDTLLAYAETSIAPNLDNPKISNAFSYIKNRIDSNMAKYAKRSQAGKKGMEERWGKTHTSKTNKGCDKAKANDENTESNITNDNKDITNDNKQVSNVNVNDNVNENVNVNVKTDIVPKKARVLQEHQKLFNYFSEIYFKKTGKKYKSGKKDFVILADLVKDFTIEEIAEKIQYLAIGCENKVYWFTDSFSDFNIGKLSNMWNELLPKLTPEQQKQKDVEERDRKIKEELELRESKK